MPHRRHLIVLLLLTLIPSVGLAHDWNMLGGQLHFTTPDDWNLIMRSTGAEEMMAFQVPDPSRTGQQTLARISVQSEPATNQAAYRHFVAAAHEHAQALPGFKQTSTRQQHGVLVYRATENDVEQIYRERYYLHAGHAVQLTCIRPLKSAAGGTWSSRFDAGCDKIATALAR